MISNQGGTIMEKKKIDLRSLTKDEFEGIRIPVLFLKIQLFFVENDISEEDCKVLARMLNAYYEG